MGDVETGNIYGDRCPPNRVWLDQCDEALAFVKIHPGATAEEVGRAIYPWPDLHEGYQLRNPARTKAAFADRRLRTLVDAGFVLRYRADGKFRYRPAGPAGEPS